MARHRPHLDLAKDTSAEEDRPFMVKGLKHLCAAATSFPASTSTQLIFLLACFTRVQDPIAKHSVHKDKTMKNRTRFSYSSIIYLTIELICHHSQESATL